MAATGAGGRCAANPRCKQNLDTFRLFVYNMNGGCVKCSFCRCGPAFRRLSECETASIETPGQSVDISWCLESQCQGEKWHGPEDKHHPRNALGTLFVSGGMAARPPPRLPGASPTARAFFVHPGHSQGKEVRIKHKCEKLDVSRFERVSHRLTVAGLGMQSVVLS